MKFTGFALGNCAALRDRAPYDGRLGPGDRKSQFSCTFIGKPSGVQASNLFNYGLGTIFSASPKSILFAEVYGNTSAFGGGEASEAATTSANTGELSGGETVGAIGYGYYLRNTLLVSFGISYDNNQAVLFRSGIEWSLGVQ